jgi:hypothetical protein
MVQRVVLTAWLLLAAWGHGHTAGPHAAAAAAAASPVTGLRATPVVAFRDTVAWSVRDRATRRYRLVVRHGAAGRIRTVHVPERSGAFDVDLGPGPDGATWAVSSRCSGASRVCHIAGVRVGATHDGAERTLAAGPGGTPTIWRDTLAYVRRAGPLGVELHVASIAQRTDRRLAIPHLDLGPAPENLAEPDALDLRGRRLAYLVEVPGSPRWQGLGVRRIDRAGGRLVAVGSDGEECSDDLASPALDDAGVVWVEAGIGDASCQRRVSYLHREDLTTGTELRASAVPPAPAAAALTAHGVVALAPRPGRANLFTRAPCGVRGSEERADGCRLTVLPLPRWTAVPAKERGR